MQPPSRHINTSPSSSSKNRSSLCFSPTMASIFRSLHKDGDASLPVLQTHTEEKIGLRKRISSMCQRYSSDSRSSSPNAFSWSFRRSKSMSAIGDAAGSSLRKWFQWTCGFFSSKRGGLFTDLEHNERDPFLGFGPKSNWFGVLSMVRFHIKKIMMPSPSIPLQRLPYDSFNYSKKSDDRSRKQGF